MTKVKFLSGYDDPQVIWEADMESLPRLNELVEINGNLYTCSAPKHIFESTGRGGGQRYIAEVRVNLV